MYLLYMQLYLHFVNVFRDLVHNTRMSMDDFCCIFNTECCNIDC